MSAPGRIPRSLDRDTWGMTVGTALIAGALSVELPFLVALTGTLAALAVASWARLHSRAPRTAHPILGWRQAVGIGILALGAGLFLLPPPPWAPLRGLLLAAALLPLWWVERRRRAIRSAGDLPP
jgi:hypothetical protein